MAAAEKASSREYWTYDGSLLISIADGASRKFHYLPPGQLTTADGAGLGAVIFEGKVSNQKYAGIAYSMDGRCGRMPYRVSGTAIDKPRGIELTGQKPSLDKNCKVTGTEPDTLKFALIDPEIAAAGETVSGQESAANAASDQTARDKDTDQAVAPKAEADKVVVAKAAAEKAADKPAVGDKVTFKAMGETAAAEKVTVDRPAPDKADKAAAEKAAADKVAAEKAAVEKAVAEMAAAEKAALDKATADKATERKTTVTKAATESATADGAEAALAKAEVERPRVESERVQADAERARKEADKAIADIGFALAAAESRIGFISGLMTGLVVSGMGLALFLFVQRRRTTEAAKHEAVAPANGSRGTQAEFDRLVAAVIAEQKRRDRKAPVPSAATPNAPVQRAPARKPRVEEPAPV